MSLKQIECLKALSGEQSPEKLRLKFLMFLLNLQYMQRGSMWVRKGSHYHCLEAVGSQSEKIKGMKLAKDKPSLVNWAMENKRMAIAEPGTDPRHCKEVEEGLDVKSTLILCFPMFQNKTKKVLGVIEIIDTSAGGLEINLDPEYLALLQDLIDIGSITLSFSMSHAKQLTRNRSLQETIEDIRFDTAFQEVMGLVKSYSATDYPVILYGESGTGKELVAQEIHRRSPRAQKPFLILNCSAIPENLLESELFGHKKGAFTGADKDKAGLFEAADGGTVFLDEIGEMDVQLQAKLLHILQNNEIKPLGGSAKKVDVRIISATNQNLEQAVQEKTFREDLYSRLNVLPLQLPLLRERPEDIPQLITHLFKREAVRSNATPKHLNPAPLPDGSLRLQHVTEVHKRLLDYSRMRTQALQELEQRKKVEASLLEREETLRNISISSLDAIIMIDSEDKVAFWNPAAKKMFGYSQEEMLGRKLHDRILADQDIALVQGNLARFAETGQGPIIGRIMELEARRKDGATFPVELSVATFSMQGKWWAVGSVKDITDRKKYEAKLLQMANTDGLTGLNSRTHFFEMFNMEFTRVRRYGGTLSLLILDVDWFKTVNDTYGHDAGDEVLRRLAGTARDLFRDVDVVGRFGGEEFVALLPETDLAGALRVAERLRESVEKMAVRVDGKEIACTVSIGTVEYAPSLPDIDAMLKKADEALYRAKDNGRNRVEAAASDNS